MTRLIYLISLALLIGTSSFGQISWEDYSQSAPSGSMRKDTIVALVTAVRMINNSFWLTRSNEGLQAALLRDSTFFTNRPADFIAINTFDTANAHFFLHGVNRKNAGNYEFRIIKGVDSILVPWSPVTVFTQDSLDSIAGLPKMAYLGGYVAPINSRIIIDVRTKGASRIQYSSVVAWQRTIPVLQDIYTTSELNEFLTRLSRPWRWELPERTRRKWQQRYPKQELDNATFLPKKLIAAAKDNNLIFYLKANIFKRAQVEYQLLKGEKVVRPWAVNEFDNSFIWLNSLSPGNYTLKIRFSAQRNNVTGYPFLIGTPWYQSIGFRIAIIVLAVAFIGFIVFGILLYKQRKRSLQEQEKKEKLQLEIKTIHAQFNPHFVFNALNSIQGLINKQDLAGANKYLSAFGQLMRNSLENTDRYLITLSEEIRILETYLNLEQLRFGFSYQIETGAAINEHETEIPSLLLQPLIENAIKHGISRSPEKGFIHLTFSREGAHMAVMLKDNGKGFDPIQQSAGYGLKLTRDRIALLNQVFNQQSIRMQINAGPGLPTAVCLTFENWFL
jgi:two-component system LytT family sensor kinase